MQGPPEDLETVVNLACKFIYSPSIPISERLIFNSQRSRGSLHVDTEDPRSRHVRALNHTRVVSRPCFILFSSARAQSLAS